MRFHGALDPAILTRAWRPGRIWAGETAVVIGNGTSLSPADVDFCRGRARVVALNSAIRLAPWADMLYACDLRWWEWNAGAPDYHGLRVCLHEHAIGQYRTKWILDTGDSGLDFRPGCVRTGKNSAYQATNLLCHLGVKKIVYLGIDMQPGAGGKTQWFGAYPLATPTTVFDEMMPLFATMKPDLELFGVQVVNATRTTALRAFPRVQLDEALPGPSSAYPAHWSADRPPPVLSASPAAVPSPAVKTRTEATRMRAYCLIRDQPNYRRDSFAAGLRAIGCNVSFDRPSMALDSNSLVVMWNCYGANETLRSQAKAAGATVIVAENGYMGTDAQGRQLYALAYWGHNGSGRWPTGGGERWDALGFKLEPWRRTGEYVLVVGQRGIGPAEMASPPNWHEGQARLLREHTKLPIVIREHPGDNTPAPVPLEQHLARARLVSVWSSSVAGKALVRGIPVLYSAPHHVLAPALLRDPAALRDPPDTDRLPALQRMAWAQWTCDEIATGEPFKRILQCR